MKLNNNRIRSFRISLGTNTGTKTGSFYALWAGFRIYIEDEELWSVAKGAKNIHNNCPLANS